MGISTTSDNSKSQSDKFNEAARDLESDENEARRGERLHKVIKHKPAAGKSA